jgi:hypothetical protein
MDAKEKIKRERYAQMTNENKQEKLKRLCEGYQQNKKIKSKESPPICFLFPKYICATLLFMSRL